MQQELQLYAAEGVEEIRFALSEKSHEVVPPVKLAPLLDETHSQAAWKRVSACVTQLRRRNLPTEVTITNTKSDGDDDERFGECNVLENTNDVTESDGDAISDNYDHTPASTRHYQVGMKRKGTPVVQRWTQDDDGVDPHPKSDDVEAEETVSNACKKTKQNVQTRVQDPDILFDEPTCVTKICTMAKKTVESDGLYTATREEMFDIMRELNEYWYFLNEQRDVDLNEKVQSTLYGGPFSASETQPAERIKKWKLHYDQTISRFQALAILAVMENEDDSHFLAVEAFINQVSMRIECTFALKQQQLRLREHQMGKFGEEFTPFLSNRSELLA